MTALAAAPDRQAAGTGTRWERAWAQPAVLAVAVLLTRLPGLLTTRLFNTDEATLSVGGRELAQGGSLYVGVIDRKPPLPFALYALFGGGDLRPVRVVIALAILASALVAASEARRRWGVRAGWAAGLVVVLGASALGPMDAQAANFELFALLPITVAVVAAARGRAAWAGVALAVAVLCKQPAAVTIVPVAWSWWQTRRWRGVAEGLVAGGVAGLVLTIPFGFAKVVEWSLLGTGGYLAMDPSDVGFALERLLWMVLLALGFWGGAWLLALVARLPVAVEPSAVGSVRRSDAIDAHLLLAASCLGVAAGFRFFPHYLVQLLPAVALLAGRGAALARPVVAKAALVWALGAPVVAAGLGWHMGLDPKPAYPKDVAAYARAHSRSSDDILVWGNVPEIYWRADRQPAGGFTHTEFVTGYSGGRRPRAASEADVPDVDLYRDWIARLRAHPPALVFDTSAARVRGGEWFPIARFPSLTRLLDERYERVATIDDIPVYRLRGLDR
ncbi:hypothetical protein KSP35_11095 [Aquihabitans sp. G128]|uniref:ArnT family glycosyltransferase n=1 Tax=Aquihabitans sp. G128 TaxID=2849779 RepID=UPI001C23B9DF|nr:hypothetical protein [Aquihabitans sp. G128]QXC63278.1 hypothetical protein KSP35_11095 [Aquihabitans sp. G128]